MRNWMTPNAPQEHNITPRSVVRGACRAKKVDEESKFVPAKRGSRKG